MKTIKSPNRASLLRHLNTCEVLATLQRYGPLSRADIARQTGISGPTVTRTIIDLLEARLVEEGEPLRVQLGRPGKVIRLASAKVAVVGVVVDVDYCEVVAAGLDGSVLKDNTIFPTPKKYEDLVQMISAKVKEVKPKHHTKFLGLGVTVPGLIDKRDNRILVSPNLHQLDGQKLADDLKDETGLDCALTRAMDGLCLAEGVYGGARGIKDFVVVDLEYGLGLGVVHKGVQLQGYSGLAGEIGHITVDINGKTCGCGNKGCLETEATDAALAAAVSQRVGRRLSIDEINSMIATGELNAHQEILRVTEYLGLGIAAIINLFNPEKVFISGKLFNSSQDIFDQVVEKARKRALASAFQSCNVLRTTVNKRQGAVASIIRQLTTDREN